MWKNRHTDIAICSFLYNDLGKIYILINLINITTFVIGFTIEEKTFIQLLIILILSGANLGIINIKNT